MSIMSALGLGEARLLEQGISTPGKVISVKTWWFIKINTKSVRKSPLDGATFPHRIVFSYQVDGKSYTGSRILSPATDCPAAGSDITVFYDPQRPEKYALKITLN